MTIGILATRYAKAMYAYAKDKHDEDEVYQDMKHLSHQLTIMPDLRKSLVNPILTKRKKTELLKAACGGTECHTTEHFFKFMFDKEKIEYMQYISTSYLTVYRKEKKVIYTVLESVVTPNDDSLKHIRAAISKGFDNDYTIEMEMIENPDLIGGFKLKTGDVLMDASVQGELNRFKKELLSRD